MNAILKNTMQDQIQASLNRLVANGTERGLQVAAFVEGKLVVNAWAGVADVRSGQLVAEDTLFPVFSTTKGIAATLVHRLAERGQVSYDQTIASVWPEFAERGKQHITVRQALNHSSGIPQMPGGIGFKELGDWEVMCKAIADLEPLWTPGTRLEYHAITYGWIVGEVAHRVDGRPFQEMLRDEIARPLNLDTLFVGIPDEVESRVAYLEEPGVVVPVDDGKPQSIPSWLSPLADWMNRADARRACVPASSGIMNALGIARHYAALLPGGVDGVELLSPARVKLATEPQRPDHPENEDYSKNFGLGYQIGGPDSIYGGRSAFGHGGYGGSIGFADPELKLAVGLAKNLFNKADSTRLILNELRQMIAS